MSTVLWFRHDLRLSDNPALAAAIGRNEPVIPLFIHSPQDEGEWPQGAASNWWLHHSLESLSADLDKAGSKLIIRRGSAAAVLEKILK